MLSAESTEIVDQTTRVFYQQTMLSGIGETNGEGRSGPRACAFLDSLDTLLLMMWLYVSKTGDKMFSIV